MALVVALAAVAAAEAVVAAAEMEVLVVVVLEKEIVSRRVQVTLSDHYMFKPEILSPIPPTPKLKSESLDPINPQPKTKREPVEYPFKAPYGIPSRGPGS